MFEIAPHGPCTTRRARLEGKRAGCREANVPTTSPAKPSRRITRQRPCRGKTCPLISARFPRDARCMTGSRDPCASIAGASRARLRKNLPKGQRADASGSHTIVGDGPPRMEARPTGSGRERSSPNCCDQCRGKARHLDYPKPSIHAGSSVAAGFKPPRVSVSCVTLVHHMSKEHTTAKLPGLFQRNSVWTVRVMIPCLSRPPTGTVSNSPSH